MSEFEQFVAAAEELAIGFTVVGLVLGIIGLSIAGLFLYAGKKSDAEDAARQYRRLYGDDRENSVRLSDELPVAEAPTSDGRLTDRRPRGPRPRRRDRPVLTELAAHPLFDPDLDRWPAPSSDVQPESRSVSTPTGHRRRRGRPPRRKAM